MKKDYIEINIKENMPKTEDAMRVLKSFLPLYKEQKVHCVLVIHGYGSTGKGGEIRTKARKWLQSEEKAGRLKSVVFGENFDIFNSKARELKNSYHELDYLMQVCNHGVTVVEL